MTTQAPLLPRASWWHHGSHGLKESIPPRYTAFIGRQLLAHLHAEVAA